MKQLFFLFLLLSLSQCGIEPVRGIDYNCVSIGYEIREYRIVHIDPPKRFDVDLQDVKTGYVWREIANKKRCSFWRNGPAEGSVVKIRATIYRDTIEDYTFAYPYKQDILDLYCN